MAGARKINGAWQAFWAVRIDGKRQQRTKFPFLKKAEALSHAQRMEDEQGRRGILDPHGFTMRSYLAFWLENHPKRAKMSPATIVGFKRHIDKANSIVGDIPLTKFNAFHIDQMCAQLRLTGNLSRRRNPDGSRDQVPMHEASVHHVFKVLKNALRQAVRWNLIPEAPTAKAAVPSTPKSPAKAMSKAERGRVLEAARTARYPGLDVIISLLSLGGLRRSEILGLTWDDVDLDAGRMLIQRAVIEDEHKNIIIRETTKTSTSRRLIDLPPGLLALLRQHRAFVFEQAMAFGADYQRQPFLVFPEVGGRVMRPSALTSKLRSLMRSAGVKGIQPVHGHRHSMASHMLAAGVDLKVVSVRLGHSSTRITHDLYVHVVEDADREAAEKLEKAFGGE